VRARATLILIPLLPILCINQSTSMALAKTAAEAVQARSAIGLYFLPAQFTALAATGPASAPTRYFAPSLGSAGIHGCFPRQLTPMPSFQPKLRIRPTDFKSPAFSDSYFRYFQALIRPPNHLFNAIIRCRKSTDMAAAAPPESAPKSSRCG